MRCSSLLAWLYQRDFGYVNSKPTTCENIDFELFKMEAIAIKKRVRKSGRNRGIQDRELRELEGELERKEENTARIEEEMQLEQNQERELEGNKRDQN